MSCVIAETFARIFYRNAINIGLPIIECKEAAEGIEAGDHVEIDFDSGVITNTSKNESPIRDRRSRSSCRRSSRQRGDEIYL